VHDEAIEAILARPAVTTARFAPDFPPDVVNIWRLAAERGLFAYDGELNGGPYRLNAAPEARFTSTSCRRTRSRCCAGSRCTTCGSPT
jgi:hypothetical protein